MAMKLNNLDTKKITRVTSVVVTIVSLAIIGTCAWFLMSALGENGGVPMEGTDIGHIETLDLKTLDKVLQDLATKRSGGEPLPAAARNPFFKKSTPSPAPQPQPEPEPPATSEEPPSNTPVPETAPPPPS